jgi:hypothetical protein
VVVTGAEHLWLAFDYNGHTWLADLISGIGQAFGALATSVAVVVALWEARRARQLREAWDRVRE